MTDQTICDLVRQSYQGLEHEPTLVLADALLETDRPDLGEDLVLILSNRRPFPREQRGEPLARLSVDRERALNVVFRRIHRRFCWSLYDREERHRALHELDEISTSWSGASLQERNDAIATTIDWLQRDDPEDSTLYERATWLFDGSFGRGAQILADEIADGASPPGVRRAVQLSAQLFRLVLAFDDMMPPNAVARVWRALNEQAKNLATLAIRRALIENGAEIGAPARAPSRRRPR